ncbi:hypothetical protein RKLH11_4342 [Rhodobacteraceae bacterium KLH11]|nr:hypothetical protein RKLH11_4342 [Rhodobacteraceae bacterium KLH11]
MAQDKTVHKRNIKDNLWRDLQVYYDKGGTNFWSYEQKPKGIYFASHIYRLNGTEAGNIRTWSTGQKGDGYLLIVLLERYSAKQLRLVRERVEVDPERVHTLLDQGKIKELRQILSGENLDQEKAA